MAASETGPSVVVCGMHRSGTSLAAHALASSGGLSLLDDPGWAVFGTDGPLAMARDPARAAEVAAHDAVKIPRAAEMLSTLLEETPHRYVVCFRNPLDVLASIVEAQYSDHPTVPSMLYYQTIDWARQLCEVDRYCAAYRAYAAQALDAARGARTRLVSYEAFVRAPAAAAAHLLDWLDIPAHRTVRRTDARVDPDHNKPAGARTVQGIGRGEDHLPPCLADHLRSTLLPVFRTMVAASGGGGRIARRPHPERSDGRRRRTP